MTHAKTHGTSDRNGGHPPCVWTMCKGQCEGTGTVPNEGSNGRWSHDNCDDCGGTGKRIDGPEAVLLEVAHGFVYPVQFAPCLSGCHTRPARAAEGNSRAVPVGRYLRRGRVMTRRGLTLATGDASARAEAERASSAARADSCSGARALVTQPREFRTARRAKPARPPHHFSEHR